MNCLKDYIGLRTGGENATVPLSGVYINQLPGLPLTKLEKLKEDEISDLAALWNDVQDRAWIRLTKDLRIAMRKRYRLRAVKGTGVVKPDIDLTTLIVPSANYRGILIDTGRKGSFLSFQVNTIAVTLSDDTEALTIKIFDQDGALLDTINKTELPAGKNTISVARDYFASAIFIAIDATAIPLYTSTIPVDVVNKCCDCICLVCDSCLPKITGGESLIATPGVVVTSTETYGIEVNFSTVCDYSGIICNNKPEFTDVWMNLIGTELMLENSFSTRLNRFTTIDREIGMELKDHYTVEYEKTLKEAIDALDIEDDDCCLECNPLATYRQVLP